MNKYLGILEILVAIFFLFNSVSDIQLGFGVVILFQGLGNLLK